MPTTLDSIIVANGNAARKAQFCSAVKQAAAAPAMFAKQHEQHAANLTALKARVLSDEIKTLFGADYDVVKAAVEELE